MKRFTIELQVTLEMDIEMGPDEAKRIDMKALHDDIAFQAEEVLNHHHMVGKIMDQVEDFTGWCASSAALTVDAAHPSKKYLESLLQSPPN